MNKLTKKVFVTTVICLFTIGQVTVCGDIPSLNLSSGISKEIYLNAFDISKSSSTKEKKIGYITADILNIRSLPTTASESINKLYYNQKIEYIFINDDWGKVNYDNKIGYISLKYISDKRQKEDSKKKLTKSGGVFYGVSGKETYYNENLSDVIARMRRRGNNDQYWIREDGVKMLGDYVIVAADLSVHPRGSLVPTSLGMGIVCDTGGFVHNGSGVALDIATTW